MSREFGVKWAAIPILSEINRSTAKKWVNRSLISARNAATAIKDRGRQARIKEGEYEGLRFQINGEKIVSPEDILEKNKTSSLYHMGM
jgi:hypothetical protein